VSSETPDGALVKARVIGSDRLSTCGIFVGVDELLAIDGDICDGIEIRWRESVFMESSSAGFFGQDAQRHLLAQEAKASWYVGEIRLLEELDNAKNSDGGLVWDNTYLLKEPNIDAAEKRLKTIGMQEEAAGEHQSDGINARWRFKGIRRLLPLAETPADGSLLWCEDMDRSSAEIITEPPRNELGMFRWLAQNNREQ